MDSGAGTGITPDMSVRDARGAAEALASAYRHFQAGQLEQARAKARAVVAARGEDADALMLLGLVACRHGRFERGVELLVRAVRAEPRHPGCHHNLGTALARLGRVQPAIDSYRRALELDPAYHEARLSLGALLLRSARPAQAETVFREALRHLPHHPRFALGLGDALRAQGKLDEAITEFRRVVDREPGHAEALGKLGASLHEQGSLDAAIAIYQRALARDPDAVEVLVNLGHAFSHGGDRMAALEQYRRAAAVDPGDADARYHFGDLLLGMGELAQAEGHLRATLEIDPSHVRGHSGLQECLLLQNRPAAVLAACDECVRVLPHNQMSVANRAFAHLAQGDESTFDYLYDLASFPYRAPIALARGYETVCALNQALVRDIVAHPSFDWQHDHYATSRRGFAHGLLEQPTPCLRAFEEVLRRAVDDFIASIEPDPAHPFLGRIPRRYEFAMWATILQSGGRHLMHNHEAAWLSGVYYARVPRVVSGEEGTGAGWLEFDGFTRYADNARYRHKVRKVRPREGLLCLFPSYFLHATAPFESAEQRISIAFDLQPLD